MKKTNPQVARTKRLLTESLLDLMEEKPFSKITVNDIVVRAELSRTAFYSHYSTKEEILCERAAELYVSNIKETMLASNKTQYENWVIAMKSYLENKRFYQLLYKNNLHSLVFDAQMANYGATMDLINQTVPSGIADRELYASVFAPYHRRADNALIMEWLSSENPVSIEEMASMICSLSCIATYDAFRENYYKNLSLANK